MLFLEGLITFSEGVCNIAVAILSVFLEKLSNDGENLMQVYRITFIVLLILSLTGFPISCFEEEEKFDFGEGKKEEEKSKKSNKTTVKIKKEIKKIEGGIQPENDESDEEKNEKEENKDEKKEYVNDEEKREDIKDEEKKGKLKTRKKSR